MEFFASDYWRELAQAALVKVWMVASILVLFFLVRFFANRLIDRLMKSLLEREAPADVFQNTARVKTICSLSKSVIFYVLVLITIIMLLDTFNIDTKAVLTAAGVIGLALGFGAQKLVRDIIAGFFVLLENQYSVGEYVTIGAVTGIVTDLGMRVTQIRDGTGKLVFISNGDITQVTNHSRGPILAAIEISVAPDSSIERARQIIDNVGREIKESVAGVISAPVADGIVAADAGRITIRVTGEVRPGRADTVQTALREKIIDRFEQDGIRLA